MGLIAAPEVVTPARYRPGRWRRGGGRSVRVYLVALVLALLLPAWAVATFTAFRLAEAGREAIAAEALETTRAVAAATEREIGALRASLIALSTSPALVEGDLARFHHQASTLAAAIGVEVILTAPDGRQLVNTTLPFGQPLPRATWSDGLDRGGAETSDMLVSEVFRAPVGGRATVAVSLPVRLPSSDPDGPPDMLSIGADAVRFWSQALRHVALPPGWSAAVRDRRGTILARQPDPERFVGQAAPSDALAVTRATLDGAQSGWSARAVTSGDGDRSFYVAWQRLSAAPWTALVCVPEAEVDGTMRRSLISVTAGGAVVVFGLSLGLAVWGTRRIARPLAELERAAAAVGRGEVPSPGPYAGLRELDAVAVALAAAAAERREREAEGAALAARLDSVLESTTDGVVMVDADWRISYANSRARQTLGRSGPGGGAPEATGLLGASLRDAFRTDPGSPFEAAFRRAMRDRLPQGVSGYHARLGLWVSADAFPGGNGGLTLFFRDVSAAKVAEAALRESEARLKAVLEHVPVGVLLAEASSGRLLLSNRRAAEILGERPGRWPLIGLGAAASPEAACGHEGGPEGWQAYDAQGRRLAANELPLARTLATGAHAQDEIRLLRPDGSMVWIRAWSAPIRDATGRLTGAVVAFADIGAEHETAEALQRQVAAEAAARQAAIAAAEALAASEERFRRFAEASPDGLWIGDPEGRRVEYLSPAFERIWGLTRANLAAEPDRWLERVHPEDRERAAAAQRRAAAGEAPATDVEYRVLLPEGDGEADPEDGARGDEATDHGPGGARLRWVRDIVFPIRDAAGRVVRVGRLVRDVTPRKRWEERQAMLMGELNHRVKNTLATVQSLARQTARGRTTPSDGTVPPGSGGGQELERFLADFQARLLALSRAHDLLTARTWRGATLGEVVTAALAPWRTAEAAGAPSARIIEEGPALWLAPRQALGLALGLHELATNAAKHGALSRRTGTVTLRWEVEAAAADADGIDGGQPAAGLACLTWRERGGPEVRPPTRTGFGKRLLERGLAVELGRDASVTLHYDPAGFEAIIRFRAAPPGVTAASEGIA